MLDKKQLIGAAVAIVVLIGVSVATGKIDINNLTGKAESEPKFERKLPPPVTDGGEIVPEAIDTSAAVDAALATTDAGSESDAYIAELTGQPVESAPAASEEIPPTATLASINPQSVVDTTSFVKTPVVKAEDLPAVAAPAAPATSAPVEQPVETPAAPPGNGPEVHASVLASSSFTSGGAVANAAIASLPSNATGEDLLRLQTQLAVIEKQKALAAGEEAIAESRLKVAKAQYEMAQIGQPTVEDRAAAKKAKEEEEAKKLNAAPIAGVRMSALDSVRVLSTSRTNGSVSATILFNGKLVDVKKGTFLSGYLVDQVTDNHVKFVGETESKTVWIN